MSPRASWKGFLKIADVTVPVGLYAAASLSERIALHTINRPTGHRVRREFVDAETGEAVDRDEQVKGYEVAKGESHAQADDRMGLASTGLRGPNIADPIWPYGVMLN